MKVFKNSKVEVNVSVFNRGVLFGCLFYKNISFVEEFTHIEIFFVNVQIDIYVFS